MKRIFTLLLVASLLMGCSKKAEEKAIKDCFEAYKTGIVLSNSEILLPLLDSHTKNYYKEVLEHIKYSKQPVVYKLNLVDRILILSARNKIPAEALREMDVNDFLKFAIDNKMIVRYDYLLDIGFMDIKEIKGKKAKAQIKYNELNKVLVFNFNKELGTWRINLSPIIQINLAMSKRKVELEGFTEDEFVIQRVKEENGGVLVGDVWQAPFSRFN